MADATNSPAMRLDELAALDPAQRREVAKELRQVAETFADVPDGKTTSQVLDVLAHLLDGGLTGAICAESGHGSLVDNAGRRAVMLKDPQVAFEPVLNTRRR